MGVELRSIQRKFNQFMGEVNPQIRPRFMVWLDERLAEFKVRGQMNLNESLDDPQWIKDYTLSKRQSKAAAIRERGRRPVEGLIQPKDEVQSESSNGLSHVEDTQLKDPEVPENKNEDTMAVEEVHPVTESEQMFQLVEVKKEQLDDNDDDDMIIIGETLPPPKVPELTPTSYTSINPSKQLYSSHSRSLPSLHRRRQKFGHSSFPHRYTISSNRLKPSSRIRQNFRFPASHASSTSQMYVPQNIDYSSVSTTATQQPITHIYPSHEESLRIPAHLQDQSSAEVGEPYTMIDPGDSDSTGVEVMYGNEYADESYFSQMYYPEDEGASESSLIEYPSDQSMIKSEGDESSTQPIPGTSTDPSNQDKFSLDKITKVSSTHGSSTSAICRFKCPYCTSTFAYDTSAKRHINFVHFKISPYYCYKCSKGFVNKGYLNMREKSKIKLVKTSNGLRYLCPICHHTYGSRHFAVLHMDYRHFRIYKYTCPECSSVFQNQSNLDYHYKSIHLDYRPFVCKCGAKFVRNAEYKRHLLSCYLRTNDS